MPNYRNMLTIGMVVFSLVILAGCGRSSATTGNNGIPTMTSGIAKNHHASNADSLQNAPSKWWIQVTSPKPNQVIKTGDILVISGQLARVQREPSIYVSLYQSPSLNYENYGTKLVAGNIPVQGSATFNGTLRVPKFNKSNGVYFILMFKYHWVPQVFIVPLGK